MTSSNDDPKGTDVTGKGKLGEMRERDERSFISTKCYVYEGVIEARADRRELLRRLDVAISFLTFRAGDCDCDQCEDMRHTVKELSK